jgi:tRNA1Val (adenine37-N6)-methyltransferase
MGMSVSYSEDRFLGGRVIVRQPVNGFRGGLDAVMLAAAVDAKSGDTILELGSGAGTASLCLAARVPDCDITGIEIDPSLVELANENAAANRMDSRLRFIRGDALDPPKQDYDHVFTNPPFHEGERSPDEMRARALQDEGQLADWLRAGLKRTKSNGTFTVILSASRLGEALNALPHRGATVIPLWPRAGAEAKRVILRLRKSSRARLSFSHGTVLHEADGRYTADADAILRGLKEIGS